MPKEMTHWIIADAARDLLPKGRLKTAIMQNPNLFHLGAVLSDSPYYSIFSERGRRFKKMGDALHGSHFAYPFKNLVFRYGAMPDARRLSFLGGALCHIAADSVLHPMVYYFTGHGDDPDCENAKRASGLHRKLETLIDISSTHGLAGKSSLSIFELTRGSELPMREFTAFLSRFYGATGIEYREDAAFAVSCHAGINRVTRQRPLYYAMTLANMACMRQFESIRALFYPRSSLKGDERFFNTRLYYKNPRTGAAYHETVAETVNRAKITAGKLLSSAQRLNASGEDWLLDLKGEELLAHGIFLHGEPMTHFADEDTRASVEALFD